MKCWNPQLVIPSSFEQCLTYEKQILYLYEVIKNQSEAIKELREEIEKMKA